MSVGGVIFLFVFFGVVCGPIAFAIGAAAYWTAKGKFALATALAIYAAYFGYETYQAFQDKPGRYGWVVLDFLGMAPWNWLGLGAAVVVGGGAEYLSARLLRR